jgi:hypothetical protein
MGNIYGLNYDFSAYSITRQSGLALEKAIDFTIYDRNQLAVLVRENQSPFTRIAYRKLGENRVIVERLQQQLMAGIILGEGQPKLIQRIRVVTGQSASQARRVAQTERTRVQSEGRHMGIMEAERIGIQMEKQWIARMVRTRDTHADLHGKTIPADEHFVTFLGNQLMHPGDSSAPAEETINCHCVEVPKVVGTSPALAAYREKFNRAMGFMEWRS